MAYDEQTAKLIRENERLRQSLRKLRDTLKTQLDAGGETWIRTLHKFKRLKCYWALIQTHQLNLTSLLMAQSARLSRALTALVAARFCT